MQRLYVLLALVLSVCAPGCNLLNQSAVGLTTPREDLSIVRSFAVIAAKNLDPAMYPLYIRDFKSSLGQAFDNDLRSQGFAVFNDDEENGINTVFRMIAVTPDESEKTATKSERVAVILSFGELLQISRIYERTPNGDLIPFSPFSLLRSGQGD